MRTVVLVDGGYLREIDPVKKVGCSQIDFHKLALLFSKESDLLRLYYYDCPPFLSLHPTSDEYNRQGRFDRFLHSLQMTPQVKVRLGRLQRTENGFVQKKVDVLLAVDLLTLAAEHSVDRIVLVAGDSDFIPAIEAAQNRGCFVGLCYSPSDVSNELLTVCDKFFPINQEMVGKILKISA